MQNLNEAASKYEESEAKSLTYDEEWQENKPEDTSSDNSSRNFDISDDTTFAKMQRDNNYKENDVFIIEYRLVDHIHTHLNPEHFKCEDVEKFFQIVEN